MGNDIEGRTRWVGENTRILIAVVDSVIASPVRDDPGTVFALGSNDTNHLGTLVIVGTQVVLVPEIVVDHTGVHVSINPGRLDIA